MSHDRCSPRAASTSRQNRAPSQRVADDGSMSRVVREIAHDVLIGATSNNVLQAEIGASQACVGYYIEVVMGDGRSAHGVTAPEPFLRMLVEHGRASGVDPHGLALCAAALRRLTDDSGVQQLADDIILATRDVSIDAPWPAWIDSAPVTLMAAWAAHREDGRLDALITEWSDAAGERHAFATIGYEQDQPGTAPHALVMGASGVEIIQAFECPVDEFEVPMSFESVGFDDARKLLAESIDDVSLLARHLLPGDLPLGLLAFLERRRDLM